jgi:phage shock protein A
MRAAVAGTIDAIESSRREATRELIAFKAGEKLMAERARELEEEAATWQARAEQAVLAGDDDLAREALQRRGWAIAELAQLQEDRQEQASYAAALLRGRRELDAKLAQLKLRQGTVAAGLAAARGANPLAAEGPEWDRLAEAERRIEDEEAEGELGQAEIDQAELAQHEIRELAKGIAADAALAELKRKMK